MATSESDIKILWGRAAGICSNPQCRVDLTNLLSVDKPYHVGEMAHVIAKKLKGPRGVSSGGLDTYDNLILLCPTCHRKVDKSPKDYPEEMLREWKRQHEADIRRNGSDIRFPNVQELKTYVRKLLVENRIIWNSLGPNSKAAEHDPGSNLYHLWNMRKLDKIVPNNSKIINTIRANVDLLEPDDYYAFLLFEQHATAFELNQYRRLDQYPLFPDEFRRSFES